MKRIKVSVLKNKTSICIRELLKYNDLGFILNNLESAILLSKPTKDVDMSDNQYKHNRKMSLGSLKCCFETYEVLSDELNLRKTTFDAIREVFPDFCTNIKDTVTSKEYNEYLILLKRVSRILSKITLEKNSNTSNTEQELLDKQDMVSRIIDSETTSRLSNIEDTFVLSQLLNLDTSKLDKSIIGNIEEIKKIITSRIELYQEYSKLYSAKEVRFTFNYNNQGREF